MITVKPIPSLMNCGDNMSADNLNIESNDDALDAVLHHIARYRLSTFITMTRLPELSGTKPRALRELLRECCDFGELSSAALHAGVRYWFLTPKGATRCGLDESRSGPLSETAKIRAYAVLLYCCGSDRPRYRLTADELSSRFPALHRPGMPGTYYLEPAESGCIGLTRIDAGHSGRWDRIVQSVRDDIALHRRLPGFRQLIQSRRFEITVLTVLPAKAERIASDLQSLPEVKHVPVHVVAQPELLPLIHSSHGTEHPTAVRSSRSTRKHMTKT